MSRRVNEFLSVGPTRQASSEGGYTHERAVGYDLDPATGTPTRQWKWERLHGPEAYPPYLQRPSVADELAPLWNWFVRWMGGCFAYAGVLMLITVGYMLAEHGGADPLVGAAVAIAIAAAVRATTWSE